MTSSAAWVMSARFFGGKFAEILIHQRRGFFQDAESADQLGRHGVAADVEMDQRAGGLRAIVAVDRNFDFAHAVGFDAEACSRRVRRCFGDHAVFPPDVWCLC